MTSIKYATVKLTRTPTDGTGQFTAVVSTFGGEPDADGDIIAPGSYDLTIAEWKAKGDLPTVWWMHGYDDPMNAIGKLTDIRIEGSRVVVDGQLDLSNPRAQTTYEGMLTGKLNEFSIGYAVRDGHYDKALDANMITDLELLEVSIVFAGANRHTSLISVKTALEAGEFDTARQLANEPTELPPLDLALFNAALELDTDLAESLLRQPTAKEPVMETKTDEQIAEEKAAEVVEDKVVDDSEEKAGRVIGAKAAQKLTDALSKAVSDFVTEVNGAAEAAVAEAVAEEKTVEEAVVEVVTDPDADLKALLAQYE